jgi:hypothetical protein
MEDQETHHLHGTLDTTAFEAMNLCISIVEKWIYFYNFLNHFFKSEVCALP